MQELKDTIFDFARQVPPEWAVALVAALPVVELRGAIPLGIAAGLPAWQALLIAFVGNLLSIPGILLLLEPISAWLRRTPVLRGFVDWMRRRAEAKSTSVRQYGWWGLVFFVAVPLPGTGAWTGAMVAAFLGYRFRPALSAVALGTALAGVIVTALSLLGWRLVPS